MTKIAKWIKLIIDEVKGYKLPIDKKERIELLKQFRIAINENKNLKKLAREVKAFSIQFPVPGIK